MEFELQLYNLATKQSGYQAIALANFLFREIIENAHSKYNISQDDMQAMCRNELTSMTLADTGTSWLSILNPDG